jgi:hypothetical protein
MMPSHRKRLARLYQELGHTLCEYMASSARPSSIPCMDLDQAAKAHAAAVAQLDEFRQAQKALADKLRAARQRVEDSRAVLADAIAQAYLDGVRVGELARRTGYSRETVRVILRAHGIEAE